MQVNTIYLRKTAILAIFMLTVHGLCAQSERAMCRAVYSGRFQKAERQVKKKVRQFRHGIVQPNGPGSSYTTHTVSLDSITNWLKRQSCVENATWDQCQNKIAIYPGWSDIGVQFRTKNGIVEKCFYIQEGTTGQVKIFGWRPKLFRSKNILVYRKMSDCTGFVENQIHNCYPFTIREGLKDSIPVTQLPGKWRSVSFAEGEPVSLIEFVLNDQKQLELRTDNHSIFAFPYAVSLTAISGLGSTTGWPSQYCFVQQNGISGLSVEYKILGKKPFRIDYLRIE